MKFESLNRGESQAAMTDWIAICPNLPSVSDDYQSIRKDLTLIFEKTESDASAKGESVKSYYFDLLFGLELYEYMNKIPGFTSRVNSDDGFWRHLSLVVCPDLVSKRWDKSNEDHFWTKTTRIWFRSLWWFIHMSWQGTKVETAKLLSQPVMSTDTIMNLVERTGRNGTNIVSYREIMKLYGAVTPAELKSRSAAGKHDLFRSVMKLNTARMMVIEPGLYPGGEAGYAASLFRDAK